MYEFLDYRVCDVMTQSPVCLAAGDALSRAQAIFEARGFNALPVVDEAGHPLGLLTQLDVLRAFRFDEDYMFPPYADIMQQTRVEQVMSEDVETVTPRTPLTRVLEKLVRTRRRSLPVVEDGAVVAMIARGDLLRALRRASQGERAG